jgi:hypothetical protein
LPNVEVTVGEEDSTAAVAEGFMVVVVEGFMEVVVEDFMEVAVEGFMEVAVEGFSGVEVSTLEATLGTAVDATTADIVAATTEVAATTDVVAVMAGAEDIGAEDTATDGAGDLASGGRIGVGDIRMATTTARGLTRPTLIIILTPTIRILTTGTTILQRKIPTHGPSPTRTDLQDPGEPSYRQAQPTRVTQTAMSRPLRRVGRFSPSTG